MRVIASILLFVALMGCLVYIGIQYRNEITRHNETKNSLESCKGSLGDEEKFREDEAKKYELCSGALYDCGKKLEGQLLDPPRGCFATTLRRGSSEGFSSIRIPIVVGYDFPNCIDFVVPLDGGSKLIDVRLPEGFIVKTERFVNLGYEGSKIAFRNRFLNAAGAQEQRFVVDIWFEGSITLPALIEVDLISMDIPAF